MKKFFIVLMLCMAVCFNSALAFSLFPAVETASPAPSPMPAGEKIPSYCSMFHIFPLFETTLEDGSICQTYVEITAEDYDAFGTALGKIGFEADTASVQAEWVAIDIHRENVQLHVEYYPEQYRMTVTYPVGSQIEAEPLRKKDIRALAATYGLKAAYDMLYAQNVDKISASINHAVCVHQDGTVSAVGSDQYGATEVNRWRDIVAVSAGDAHTLGLRSNGTVAVAGGIGNNFGQCDVGAWQNIVAIDAGFVTSVGLKADGTVVAVGRNDSGELNVSGWTDIVAVSSDVFHTVALKADGTVVATGKNDCGQCNVDKWHDIVAVDTTLYFTFGLCADGTVVAAGKAPKSSIKKKNNDYGQGVVSDWRDIVAISADYYNTIGVKRDGTVVSIGYDYYGLVTQSSDWKDIRDVSVGPLYSIGLTQDGRVVAAGREDNNVFDAANWTDVGNH